MNVNVTFHGQLSVNAADENLGNSIALQMLYDRLKNIDGFSYIRTGMPGCEVRICRVNDWEGLYIDNEIAIQGHHLDVGDVLHCLENAGNINFISEWCNEKQIEELGGFPHYYTDLKMG